jgi:hypothetical protein
MKILAMFLISVFGGWGTIQQLPPLTLQTFAHLAVDIRINQSILVVSFQQELLMYYTLSCTTPCPPVPKLWELRMVNRWHRSIRTMMTIPSVYIPGASPC